MSHQAALTWASQHFKLNPWSDLKKHQVLSSGFLHACTQSQPSSLCYIYIHMLYCDSVSDPTPPFPHTICEEYTACVSAWFWKCMHDYQIFDWPLSSVSQDWAETEGGLIRASAAYCLDRFQRYSKSRLDVSKWVVTCNKSRNHNPGSHV